MNFLYVGGDRNINNLTMYINEFGWKLSVMNRMWIQTLKRIMFCQINWFFPLMCKNRQLQKNHFWVETERIINS